MSDDTTEPEGGRPATSPTARRPPSQSDIHGISTIASVPFERDRRRAPAPPSGDGRPDDGADDGADDAPRREGG